MGHVGRTHVTSIGRRLSILEQIRRVIPIEHRQWSSILSGLLRWGGASAASTWGRVPLPCGAAHMCPTECPKPTMSLATAKERVSAAILSVSHVNLRFSIDRAPCPIAIGANGLTVSQERGFGSNHLVFLKARPQHAMGRCELRILGYTRYNARNLKYSNGQR